MKSLILVTCFLTTSLLSQSQWQPGTGGIFYNDGNIGIGTSTPERKLHVEGAITLNGDVKLGQPDLGWGKTLWFGTSTVNADPFVLGRYNVAFDQSELRLFLGDDGGDKMVFGYNSGGPGVLVPTVSIVASGKISIGGTYIPSGYRLAVEGNIIAEKVKVQMRSAWPDYVFDSSYQLLSLNKVEQFIRQYKHLPQVPSAEEVEKNGLDLGDNQAILLKKIEELTLYLIEQNKKMEAMQKELQQLKMANNKP